MSFRRSENAGIKPIIKQASPGAQPATKEAPKISKDAEGKEVLEEEEVSIFVFRPSSTKQVVNNDYSPQSRLYRNTGCTLSQS